MSAESLSTELKYIQKPKKSFRIFIDAIRIKKDSMGSSYNGARMLAFVESALHKVPPQVLKDSKYVEYQKNELQNLRTRSKSEAATKMEAEDLKQLKSDLLENSKAVLKFFSEEPYFIVLPVEDVDKDFVITDKGRRLVEPLRGDMAGVINWSKQIGGILSARGVNVAPRIRRSIAENLYEALWDKHRDTEFTLRRLYQKKITAKDPWTVFEAPQIPEYNTSLNISSWEALEFGMVNVSTWRSMLALAHLDQYSGKQMMVLEGPTNTGKGTILGALEEIIFSKDLTSHKESFSGSNFSKESMLGKKFNFLYDTNKESLLLRGDFLSVIGGEDAVEVERKHKTSVTQTMRIFSVVATNRMLWMDNSPQLKTRIVPVLIKLEKNKEGDYIRGPQLEGDVRKQLREQLPAYMSYCIHALSKRQTKEDGSLILKKKDEELQQRLIYDFLSPISNFIHLNTKQTYNPDDMVPIPSLIALYKTSPEFSSGRADYIVASILDLFPRLSKKENHRKVLCISGLQIIGEKEEV